MIPAHVRIFVCTAPVDMRRGFDGLALAVRERLDLSVSTLLDGVALTLSDGFPVSVSRAL